MMSRLYWASTPLSTMGQRGQCFYSHEADNRRKPRIRTGEISYKGKKMGKRIVFIACDATCWQLRSLGLLGTVFAAAENLNFEWRFPSLRKRSKDPLEIYV